MKSIDLLSKSLKLIVIILSSCEDKKIGKVVSPGINENNPFKEDGLTLKKIEIVDAKPSIEVNEKFEIPKSSFSNNINIDYDSVNKYYVFKGLDSLKWPL